MEVPNTHNVASSMRGEGGVGLTLWGLWTTYHRRGGTYMRLQTMSPQTHVTHIIQYVTVQKHVTHTVITYMQTVLTHLR